MRVIFHPLRFEDVRVFLGSYGAPRLVFDLQPKLLVQGRGQEPAQVQCAVVGNAQPDVVLMVGIRCVSAWEVMICGCF